MNTKAAAKAIYENLCKEGIEECFIGIPFDALPEHIQKAYERIALAALNASSLTAAPTRA
jgi:hypothetical protein